MIKTYRGNQRGAFGEELRPMFELRKKVFHDLLGWDVTITDGIEIDDFDNANPLYVLSCSEETGKLRGALRLLPTTGPNMLDDTFPVLLDHGQEIRDSRIWESSRFCIDPDISQDRSSNQVTVAAAELMCAVGEMGLASGITKIVTVTDIFLERMFRRMGCPGERIGKPRKVGVVTAIAVSWDVNEDLLNRMKRIAGINGSLFKDDIPRVAAHAA